MDEKYEPILFTRMSREAARRISRRRSFDSYTEQVIDCVRQRRPILYEMMNQAENKLAEAWKASVQGERDVELFRKALRDWYHLYLLGMDLHSQEPTQRGD